jgi:hypothetical protein
MRRFAICGLRLGLIVVAGMAGRLAAQEAPKAPTPQKEHAWLQQFVGEWETEAEAVIEPGKPPMKCQGTEKARAIGGLWVVSEITSSLPGQTMTGLMTIGYDAEKKKYVGTWIDSMTPHLWKYEGSVDAAGKILTLEAEGPNMMVPGKMAKYRDVTELKNKDHKVLTSSMLGDDGKWTTFMTMQARRKK